MKLTLMSLADPADPNGFESLLASVDAAAQAGFSRFWLPQLPPVEGLASWDALTTLAVAGARTPDIGLATGVVVAQTQHPFVLARQALTTAAATDGRLLLGIGVSHRWVITDIFGYDFSAPAAYLREYLEVLKPALAGEPVDHHGARITAIGQLTGSNAPPPPILAAALGPRMLQLAGELTDGTVTTWTGTKALEEHVIPRITAAAAAAGRPDPQVVAGLPVSVTDDVESTRTQIQESFAAAQQTPAYRAVLDLNGAEGPADVSLIGSEEQIIAQLRRFAEVGVTEFTAIPFGDAATQIRTTKLLAESRDLFE